LIATVLAIVLAGCGEQATSSTALTASGASTASTSSATRAASRTAMPRRRPAHGGKRTAGGLAYSTASAQIVQDQPPAGSCHSIGAGLYSRPDPHCTPGALNPAVTQTTIEQTICRDGWTDTVRPPESVTEPEKQASIAAYGDTGPTSAYEFDHLVPLELGGAVNDPRNLWPEPGSSPNPKDAVEDELNGEVCDGQLTLLQAQRAIATDWLTAPGTSPGPELGEAPPGTRTAAAPAPMPTVSSPARCAVTASYNGRYHDYDVYVHSNQPGRTVTVTGPGGRTATWHTNASGYADVYLNAGSDAAGQTITGRVGNASCQGAL
jgi:hypothetical protein